MSAGKVGLVFAAFALAFSVAPDARADHARASIAAFLFTPFGHATQTPGYVSVLYYGVNPEKRMPTAWLAANVVTSLLGGGVGIATLREAWNADNPSHDTTPYALAGASVVTGSAVVIIASALQTARPRAKPAARADTTLRSLVALPTGGVAPNGASTAGLSIAGRF